MVDGNSPCTLLHNTTMPPKLDINVSPVVLTEGLSLTRISATRRKSARRAQTFLYCEQVDRERRWEGSD